MKKNAGLITYHSAYNFGSMLQAYATQQTIEKLGYSCEMINYRMKSQKEFYTLIRTRYGLNNMVNDLLLIPEMRQRRLRAAKFEDFMAKYMKLSKEYSEPEQLTELRDAYDVVVSGSDQIWNKLSNELARADFKYITPYFLEQFNGHKISYASSLAGMNDEDLKKAEPLIREFAHISMREDEAAKRMEKLLGREVASVLDPTFLLTKEEWDEHLRLGSNNNLQDYYLFYSLNGGKHGYTETNTILHNIEDGLCKDRNRKIVTITPFLHIKKTDRIRPQVNIGPRGFLSLIRNASEIITNSYHGTILSVNLNKPVVSLCNVGAADNRKVDVLNKLGLNSQVINSVEEIGRVEDPIDYEAVNEKLAVLRQASIDYLENSLKD